MSVFAVFCIFTLLLCSLSYITLLLLPSFNSYDLLRGFELLRALQNPRLPRYPFVNPTVMETENHNIIPYFEVNQM